MSSNCDVNVIFWIYGQFWRIRKLNSRCIVYKTYISSNSNLLSYTNWIQSSEISNIVLHTIALRRGTKVVKNVNLLQKNGNISKIKKVLSLNGIFSETKYGIVFTYQISSF